MVGKCIVLIGLVSFSFPSHGLEKIPLKDPESLVKVRCELGGAERFLVWEGSAYSQVPDEPQRHLFDYVGMNVARCLKKPDGSWYLTSRELMYYTDPSTGQVINRWLNPWSGESVPVVHIANDLVQIPLSVQRLKLEIQHMHGVAVIETDINLSYPSPLAQPKYAQYAPQRLYQASELTKYQFSLDDLEVADEEVSQVAFSWMRTSGWLPWMKMGEQQGFMTFSAWGVKTADYENVSPMLREEIETRLDGYRHAPRCWVDGPNETSFSYFGKYFEEYLGGQRFPLDTPVRECRSPLVDAKAL